MDQPAHSAASALKTFFLRECALAIHGRGSGWIRFSIVIVSLLAAFTGGFLIFPFSRAADGLHAFGGLMVANALFAFAALNSYWCKAISDEKEKGSLDYIRITALSTFALLAGKGTSQWVRGMFLGSLQFPVCAICLCLGGISMAQMLAFYAILSAFLFFGCHVALLVSVLCKTNRSASQATLGILIFLYVTPLFLLKNAAALSLPQPFVTILSWLSILNPFSAYWSVSLTGAMHWEFILTHLAGGAFFFWLAVSCFEWACAEAKPAPPVVPRAAIGNRPRKGPLPRIEGHALTWKEFHFSAGGAAGVRFRWWAYPLACAVLFFYVSQNRGTLDILRFASSCLLVGVIGLVAEAATATTRLFGMEAANRTLADIAILPMRTRTIVWEKVMGYVPCFLPPLACIIVGGVIRFLGGVGGDSTNPVLSNSELPWVITSICFIATQAALALMLTIHLSFQQTRAAFGAAVLMLGMAHIVSIGLLHICFDALNFSPGIYLATTAVLSIFAVIRLIQLLPHHLMVTAAK